MTDIPSFSETPTTYGTPDYTNSFDQTPVSKPKDQSQQLLLVVITVLVLIVVAVYAIYGGVPNRGGSTGVPDPCKSTNMPALAPGLSCNPSGAGRFAGISAQDPATTGVGPPPSGSAISSVVATDTACYDEVACQAKCTADGSCTFYIYDSSKQTGSANCPMTGSVCTTYSGPLPTTIPINSNTMYTTGGIPATLLPPPSGEKFAGVNFGAGGWPYC